MEEEIGTKVKAFLHDQRQCLCLELLPESFLLKDVLTSLLSQFSPAFISFPFSHSHP